MARYRRRRTRASARAARGPAAVQRRCSHRHRDCRHRGHGAARWTRGDRVAARLAGSAVSSSARRAVRVLPGAARQRQCGDLAVLVRLLPGRRNDGTRAHLFPVPRVPGGDGARARRRRRLRLHGRVGDDGARVVLPRHHRSPRSGDPASRFPVPARRARGRHRHPAVLRRAAGRPRRLHVRRNARRDACRQLAKRRVLPRTLRVRRQGGCVAAARLAAGSPPGGALARLGHDERRDAEDWRSTASFGSRSISCTCNCGGGARSRWRSA